MLKNMGSKKIAQVILVVGLVLVAVAGLKMMKKKKSVEVVKNPQELVKSVASTLPKEGQERMFINPDKQAKGKNYLSSVFMSEDADKAPETVSNYVYKSFQQIYGNDLKDVSAVTIAIYIKSKKEQYRIILGKTIADQKDSAFWEKGDKTELFKWLTETCPKTNPADLANFCDISETLKVKSQAKAQ